MSLLTNIKILTGKKPALEKLPQPKKKKILIVEDEKPLSVALRDEFLAQGFQVITAENGKEGLDAATIHKPDAIVLDLLMPVMNGTLMLRKLREIPEFKYLPVIILTNAGDIENIRETVTFDKAVEFLIKSNVTMKEIIEKVKRSVW